MAPAEHWAGWNVEGVSATLSRVAQDGSERIAPTGHYTAYTWAALGLQYGQWFATPLGRRLFRAYRLVELPLRNGSYLTRSLRNRHLTIDAEIGRLTPDLVVELGAGLSPRGVALALDHATAVVEIDLPVMVALKQRLVDEHADAVQQATLAERWELLSADILADTFVERLAGLLSGAHTPVVVMEGVLGYFDPERQLTLLQSVHRALDGRGALLVDLRIPTAPTWNSRLVRLAIRVATRGRGGSFAVTDLPTATERLHRAGFGNVELLRDQAPDAYSRVVRADPSPTSTGP